MPISYKTRTRIRDYLSQEVGARENIFGAGIDVALTYPNSYFVGMSNLGFHYVYETLNRREGWNCERVFTDLHPPISLENARSLDEFDIIAFSVSYELDFLNVLRLLSESNIPLLRSKRDENSPLVIAGGTGIMMNYRALSTFVDLCFLGDGERSLTEFTRIYEEKAGHKSGVIEAAGTLDGVLAPHEKECKNVVPPSCAIADITFPCSTSVLSSETEFSNRYLVEISRGCPYNCSFCLTGHSPLPYREFPLQTVIEAVERGRAWTDRFGFVASAVAGYGRIEDLCKYCDTHGLDISFSSVRADHINETFLKSLARTGQHTLTLAPETGDQELRYLIKKKISDETFYGAVENALDAGIRNIRLYFMIGLPQETDESVEETVRMISRIQKILKTKSGKWGRIGKVIVSLGIFIPKPYTPFDSESMLPVKELRKRLRHVRGALGRMDNVQVTLPGVYEALAQSILSNEGDLASNLLLWTLETNGNWGKTLRERKTDLGRYSELL